MELVASALDPDSCGRVSPPEAVRLIPGADIAPDDVVTGERAAYGIHRPNSVYAYTIVVDRDTYEYLGKHGTITIDDREVEQVIRLVDSGVVDEIGQRPR
jgi:hypothetical protein